jgi:hypothetical protein
VHFIENNDGNNFINSNCKTVQESIDSVVSKFEFAFLYLDLYEGFYPCDRWEKIDDRDFYPLAHAYDSTGEYAIILVWIISNHKLLIEKLSEEQFSALQRRKCLWIKGTFDVSKRNDKTIKSLEELNAFENNETNNNINYTSNKTISTISSSNIVDLTANTTTTMSNNINKPPIIDLVKSNNNMHDDIDEKSISSAFFFNNHDPQLQFKSKNVPVDRLKSESEHSNLLSKLYDEPLKNKNVTVSVGGRDVILCAFHYPAENLSAPRNELKREYVDESETVVLYRWELKGALCTKLRNVSLFL